VIIAVLIITIICLAVFLPRGKTVIEEVDNPELILEINQLNAQIIALQEELERTTAPTVLSSKAEVENWLPDAWFSGISWELMLSRINEKFPGIARAEFQGGARFMVVTVKEGDHFVAPENKLRPWPP